STGSALNSLQRSSVLKRHLGADMSQVQPDAPTAWSAFEVNGIADVIEHLSRQVQSLYLSDGLAWVIGYSGGKESTATLQLVWRAIQALPEDQRTKEIHVI